MNGYPDKPPVRVGTIIGDLAASLYAAIGTLAALREAEKTHRRPGRRYLRADAACR